MDKDIEPPPLEDMTEIIEKLHLDTGQQSLENVQSKLKPEFPEENVNIVPPKSLRRTEDKTSLISITPTNPILINNDAPKVESPSPSKSLEPFKKGFLNTTSKQTKSKSKTIVKDEIPFIRPTKSKEQNDNIPDFMRVQDPDRVALQKEVHEMLVPTQELVKDVMETTDVKTCLEDPEIMEAVSEIAGNPDAMLKYKHNKKITEFYNHLGKLMKDKMDKQDKMANSKK
ncbi:hypothetical protein KC19_3G046600 [Ceratodon purpureus]|uniref:STI1/HOP DP domain-containing protein n=1 Tax=Ceratodon purpureus TaxID=3225 RepID=A0A8T0IEV9_CERPU|nr:hypothetical protein KC19_3G046600 [Ceratodon purpureus]KAG0582260.1 hypothetical protein KC19_3G046600 [Ceratodon purpureus]